MCAMQIEVLVVVAKKGCETETETKQGDLGSQLS